jgi:hypothetical protein
MTFSSQFRMLLLYLPLESIDENIFGPDGYAQYKFPQAHVSLFFKKINWFSPSI